MPSLADVVITVTKFTPNSSPVHPPRNATAEHCEIGSELGLIGRDRPAKGTKWKFDDSEQIFICPPPDVGTIAIRKRGDKPVEFTFAIASAEGVPALRPTAIVFEQQKFKNDANRSLTDVDGSDNFKLIGIEKNGLSLADRCTIQGKSKDRRREQHAAPFWKFWIRVETTDASGKTVSGWIDPTIENSDDMQGFTDPDNPDGTLPPP
jgi:hypothetical protein